MVVLIPQHLRIVDAARQRIGFVQSLHNTFHLLFSIFLIVRPDKLNSEKSEAFLVYNAEPVFNPVFVFHCVCLFGLALRHHAAALWFPLCPHRPKLSTPGAKLFASADERSVANHSHLGGGAMVARCCRGAAVAAAVAAATSLPFRSQCVHC